MCNFCVTILDDLVNLKGATIMGIVDILIEALFIPLWPFGIIVPIIATVVVFYKRRNLVKFVPFATTGMWFLVRLILMWQLIATLNSPDVYVAEGFPVESLLVVGTMGMAFAVLVLSMLFSWVTFKILERKQK